jgi:hypothetical protein
LINENTSFLFFYNPEFQALSLYWDQRLKAAYISIVSICQLCQKKVFQLNSDRKILWMGWTQLVQHDYFFFFCKKNASKTHLKEILCFIVQPIGNVKTYIFYMYAFLTSDMKLRAQGRSVSIRLVCIYTHI